MSRKILVVYKSVTGFTKQYAEKIAEELNCSITGLQNISPDMLSGYDTIIYGGRFYAGTIDGLKKARKLYEESTASLFIVFATGATPNSETQMINEAWERNFSADELNQIPHFYMQGGLRYDRMSPGDKLLMKLFAAMMRKKKNKSENEKKFSQAINSSYDISSDEVLAPLLSYLREDN